MEWVAYYIRKSNHSANYASLRTNNTYKAHKEIQSPSMYSRVAVARDMPVGELTGAYRAMSCMCHVVDIVH